ncbi:hypothetical protein [Gordonia sp. N1V]|uniref:hypothetical protein n=1 Tax=Gordonia sp. N1V TaxID=3034163 RepID=UPI0023E0FCA7|nr:hypothetical protein [Gordonia sp. N1V]MDF3280479.1 hypothetical protein [Gordonia sp. N1V]
MADENTTTDNADATTSTDSTSTSEQQTTTEQTSAKDTSTEVDDDKLGEGGKKALDAERAARKDAEKRLAAYEAEQKKRERAKLDDTAKAQAERDDALKAVDAANRRAALAEAAVAHGLTKDDLELLEDTPVDKIDAKAKKLAALRKASAKTGSSGGEATGARGAKKPTTLQGAISAAYQ